MANQARILIVDDDQEILGFLRDALADEGYETITATDGAQALDLAAQCPPDLILLDMRMPGMDGWEFARHYRAQPGPHAPIIVVTAAVDVRSVSAQIQAQGHLAKPFSVDRLLAVVQEHTGPQALVSTT